MGVRIEGLIGHDRTQKKNQHNLNWFSTKRAVVEIGEIQHFQLVLQLSAGS
jgi:flavin-binding protein dodecin